MKKVTFLTITALLTLGVATPVLASEPKDSTADITLKEDADGPLRIEKATTITFGIDAKSGSYTEYLAHYLGDTEKTADDKYRPNYIQVIDNRGTNQGWTLSVKNDGFKGINDKNEEVTLVDAQLVLTSTHALKNNVNPQTQEVIVNDEVATDPVGFVFNSKVKVSGTANQVAGAKNNFGNGVNNIYFGQLSDVPSTNDDLASKNTNIILEVPGESKKESIKYTSNLVWTLTDDPAS